MSKYIGNKYGKRTVIEKVENGLYKCECDCGRVHTVPISALKAGKRQMCNHCKGKKRAEQLSNNPIAQKHGYYKANDKFTYNLYQRWTSAWDKYPICDEWLDFEDFKKWCINNNISNGVELHMIDKKGLYSPDNLEIKRKEDKKWLILFNTSK